LIFRINDRDRDGCRFVPTGICSRLGLAWLSGKTHRQDPSGSAFQDAVWLPIFYIFSLADSIDKASRYGDADAAATAVASHPAGTREITREGDNWKKDKRRGEIMIRGCELIDQFSSVRQTTQTVH
jgi:hypothetical protein